MHGRKRSEYKSRLTDPKVSSALALKAQQYHTLSRELFSLEKHPKPKLLELTSKLLRVNPDPSHIWNRRRELLGNDFDIDTELNLTFVCLERNPKAYAAWFHRKWCLKKSKKEILEKELELCALLLTHDERNFHCWNYRRFVVAAMMNEETDGSWNTTIMGPQLASINQTQESPNDDMPPKLLQQEWDFTTKKIHENFSNCSAFHYRSKLLPLMKNDLDIPGELELIQNAIYTEPDDQTAWWYHRFVLEYALALASNESDQTSLLTEQQTMLQELLEVAGACKWGLLAMMNVCLKLKEKEQARDCLVQLQTIDSDRVKRYQYIMKQEEL